MAITATYVFSPAIPSGSIVVTGNTESEVKAAVKAVVATRRTASQTSVDALNAADTALDN
jgi:hypothetical protein